MSTISAAIYELFQTGKTRSEIYKHLKPHAGLVIGSWNALGRQDPLFQRWEVPRVEECEQYPESKSVSSTPSRRVWAVPRVEECEQYPESKSVNSTPSRRVWAVPRVEECEQYPESKSVSTESHKKDAGKKQTKSEKKHKQIGFRG